MHYLKILKPKISSNSRFQKYKKVGNLKYYGEKKFFIKINQIEKKFKKFKIWCAASTHETEEILIAKLHKELKKYQKKLITIIIPRHIHRSEKIIEDLKK